MNKPLSLLVILALLASLSATCVQDGGWLIAAAQNIEINRIVK
ncbi:MAG TPA: hypothetical protein VJR26_09460 [Candidatus Acidoferrales bacterium]|nr:hypothetical protein [Candidatus Acidoferrales bacterium]